jgi:hypothetical protein
LISSAGVPDSYVASHSIAIPCKPDATKELARFTRSIHDDGPSADFLRQMLDFVEHHASDALFSQFPLYDNVVHAKALVRDLHRHHGHQLADELSDQAALGDIGPVAVADEELADRLVVGAVDGADEKALSAHVRARRSE